MAHEMGLPQCLPPVLLCRAAAVRFSPGIPGGAPLAFRLGCPDGDGPQFTL